jgi:RNA polymerase sigma factor (sigma-70 family)
VQSTMLRTSRHWRRARAAPQAYSRQVLVNVCRENWRRQASRPVEVRSPDAALGHDGGSFTDQIDQRATLDHALSALSSTQREVLVLRFFFDLSVEQTAALLGIAAGTVKSATSRGLGQLRQILDPSDAKEFLC